MIAYPRGPATKSPFWCSGLGAVEPPVVEGEPAPTAPALVVVDPVVVTIGGQEANVLSARLAPGFTGLYRVHAIVPEGVQPGTAVDVMLRVSGQASQPVTMAVQ